MSNTVQHWYKIPDKTLEKAKKNGFPNCPTEIALKPQDGQGVELSLQANLKNKSMDFATRKVVSTICGVNHDPARDPSKRKEVSRASGNPELFPDFVFQTLPAAVVTMLMDVFSEVNDPEEDELADFKKSHSAVV